MIAVTAAATHARRTCRQPSIIAAIAATNGTVFAKYRLNNRNRISGYLSTALRKPIQDPLREPKLFGGTRA